MNMHFIDILLLLEKFKSIEMRQHLNWWATVRSIHSCWHLIEWNVMAC